MPFPEKNWLAVACGQQHLIVATKSEIYGSGNNQYGQLGIGNTSYRNITPLKMVWQRNFGEIKNITCGDYDTGVLTEDGKVYICGGPTYCTGQGLGQNEKLMKEVGGLKDIVSLKLNKYYCFAVDEQGKLYAWGQGYLGTTVSFGSSQSVKTPTLVTANGLNNEKVKKLHYAYTCSIP
eukprot:1081694-Amorphochlora_amoeboformis.AAC.2